MCRKCARDGALTWSIRTYTAARAAEPPNTNPAMKVEERFASVLDRNGRYALKAGLEHCLEIACDGEKPDKVFKALAAKCGTAKSTCSIVWKRGSIAYRCLTCEVDPTSAVCAECFHGGQHVGHDYRLVHTSGGCCDCGDPTAWHSSGFCKHHGLKHDADGNPLYKPPLPPALRANMAAMLDAVCARLLFECASAFPPTTSGEEQRGGGGGGEPARSTTGQQAEADAVGWGSARTAPAAAHPSREERVQLSANRESRVASSLNRATRQLVRGAQQGDVATVEKALRQSDVDVNCSDGSEFDTTALHWASQVRPPCLHASTAHRAHRSLTRPHPPSPALTRPHSPALTRMHFHPPRRRATSRSCVSSSSTAPRSMRPTSIDRLRCKWRPSKAMSRW